LKNYLNVFLSSWIIKDYQYKWNNSFIFSYFTLNLTSLQWYFWKYFKIIYWFEKIGLFYTFTFCRYLKKILLLKYFWILKVASIIYGNLNILNIYRSFGLQSLYLSLWCVFPTIVCINWRKNKFLRNLDKVNSSKYYFFNSSVVPSKIKTNKGLSSHNLSFLISYRILT
jgi:hypothetical protein